MSHVKEMQQALLAQGFVPGAPRAAGALKGAHPIVGNHFVPVVVKTGDIAGPRAMVAQGPPPGPGDLTLMQVEVARALGMRHEPGARINSERLERPSQLRFDVYSRMSWRDPRLDQEIFIWVFEGRLGASRTVPSSREQKWDVAPLKISLRTLICTNKLLAQRAFTWSPKRPLEKYS